MDWFIMGSMLFGAILIVGSFIRVSIETMGVWGILFWVVAGEIISILLLLFAVYNKVVRRIIITFMIVLIFINMNSFSERIRALPLIGEWHFSNGQNEFTISFSKPEDKKDTTGKMETWYRANISIYEDGKIVYGAGGFYDVSEKELSFYGDKRIGKNLFLEQISYETDSWVSYSYHIEYSLFWGKLKIQDYEGTKLK